MAKEKPTVTGKAKRLWAAVNHSPEQVLSLMNKLSQENFGGKLRSQIILEGHIRKSEFDEKAHIWIVVSAYTLDLLTQKKVDMTKATIILIENCAVATQYKGIMLLDCDQTKSYVFKFKPLDSQMVLNLRTSKDESLVDIQRTKVDIISALLNAQPPSALAAIMTFAYTIESSKRGRYVMDIFGCIRNGTSLQEVDWFNPENKRMATLLEWLESPIGRSITKALADALAKTKPDDGDVEYYKLAEEYGISKFDINYSVELLKRNSNVANPEMDTSEMYALSEHRQD